MDLNVELGMSDELEVKVSDEEERGAGTLEELSVEVEYIEGAAGEVV